MFVYEYILQIVNCVMLKIEKMNTVDMLFDSFPVVSYVTDLLIVYLICQPLYSVTLTLNIIYDNMV